MFEGMCRSRAQSLPVPTGVNGEVADSGEHCARAGLRQPRCGSLVPMDGVGWTESESPLSTQSTAHFPFDEPDLTASWIPTCEGVRLTSWSKYVVVLRASCLWHVSLQK